MQHGVCVSTEFYTHIPYLMNSALIFFEYILTFPHEVKLFWGKKLTGAVALFFTNRYTTIIYTMYLMLINLVPTISGTAQVGLLHLSSGDPFEFILMLLSCIEVMAYLKPPSTECIDISIAVLWKLCALRSSLI